MSVRNILDGTIKVGGDGSGTSKRELFVEELSADRCYFTNIERCGIIKTTNLIADGSIDMQVGINEPKPLAYITKGDKITVEADNLIAGSSLTVGKLNLFAEDQVLNETMQFDFTDGSRTITSVQAKAEATYLSITQYLHLFQLTINNLTGMPTTLIEFSVTIPKILPTSNFTLHDAVSVLLADTMPVGCALTIKATKGESLVVTFSFNTALQNPSSLSARFLRELP